MENPNQNNLPIIDEKSTQKFMESCSNGDLMTCKKLCDIFYFEKNDPSS